MDKKNVVIIPMLIPKEKDLDKFGGWKWMEYSKQAWQYWCDKNGHELVIYDKPSIEDTSKFRVTVQRWFDYFNFLDEKNIKYDQVASIDASSIPKWDCPDFFKLTDDKLTVGIENDNLAWVYEGVNGYKHMFDDYELDINKYFCSSFMIFNNSHRKLFDDFKEKYMDNADEFINLQKTVRRGTCQTPLNYIVQMSDVEVNYLPSPFRLSHLHRKDMLKGNWQLNEDSTPFFIKYGYIWFFSGFDKQSRNQLMNQTWDLVKDNYDNNYILNKLVHKDEWCKTTSRKFKEDILRIFDGKKDLTLLELGCCRGDTTRVFSECFKKIYSYERSDENVEHTRQICSDVDNVEVFKTDVYDSNFTIPDDIDIAFVDAGHATNLVEYDIKRLLEKNKNMILIFDDYGQADESIKKAINNTNLNISRYIGEYNGFTCTNLSGKEIKFIAREGVICNMG
jgi:hypothetical protein|tara:strand:- start:2556 stop:3905 length:1350 start_codon:yes stop_codon:yes gene_type:complete